MALIQKIGGALNALLARAAATRRLDGTGRPAIPGASQPLGPGVPLGPREPRGTEPRGWIYTPGVNIAQAPRNLPGLTPFQELRNFAASYDVVRICVETRKQQLRGLKWDVVVRNPAANPGSDFRADIERAVAFMSYPDGQMTMSAWLNAALEDVLVVDALSIYRRRDRGGRLMALELVDGATVKPLIDEYGRPPQPPAPAYQQFAYGFAWAQFGLDEIMYCPYNPRTFINYGFSPVEQIVVTAMVGLSREVAAINHYKEGNTPAGFGEVPKDWTSSMIREFEEIFNGLLAGDFAARSRIKMVPAGFNFKPWVESNTTFNTTYDEYLARIVCAAFGVPPTQFIRSFNRATAEAVDEATTVSGFDPLKEFVERLLDGVVIAPDGLNLPHLRFTFTTEKRRDEELELQKNVEYLRAGVLSIDDVLVRLGMEPIGVGRFVTVPGQGVVVLDSVFHGERRLEERLDPALGQTVSAPGEEERAELGKWLRKARRVVARHGEGERVDAGELQFDSNLIEPTRRARIESALLGSRTAEDVATAFNLELDAGASGAVKERPPSASEIDHVARALAPGLLAARARMSELVVRRSGIHKDGFRRALKLFWFHDRAPLERDLSHGGSEFFDDGDLNVLSDEMSELLAEALAMRPSLSAGFPPAGNTAETQSMRPGALPPGSLGERDGTREREEADGLNQRAADRGITRATAMTRARLNRLLDLAHERELTTSELRDAVSRATDFSIVGAKTLAIQALIARGECEAGTRQMRHRDADL